jgi:DCN1-like protein 1/2
MERFIQGSTKPKFTTYGSKLTATDTTLKSDRGYYGSDQDSAVADVKVSKGCWVYEVTFSGSVRIGWATNQFNGTDPVGQNADSWVLRLNEGSLMHKNGDGKATAWVASEKLSGKTISCVLDVENASVWYYADGVMLGGGAAFTSVRGSASTTFTPVFSLSSSANVTVNWGRKLKYPIAGAISLVHEVSSSQEKSIRSLWEKYYHASISLSESGDRGTIKSQGVLDLAKDILDDEEKMQLVLAVLAWKLRASTVWEFSEPEFISGLTLYAIYDLKTFQNIMKQWLEELETPHIFKTFYSFLFSYMLPPQRVVLDIPEAIETWNVLGFPTKWVELWPRWTQFIETKKTISKDAWVLVPSFLNTVGVDLSGFDESACWPAIFEDFIDWAKENK